MGVRLIKRLVANGTLTEADAAQVYARTLANISDPAQRPATSRILKPWMHDADRNSAT